MKQQVIERFDTLSELKLMDEQGLIHLDYYTDELRGAFGHRYYYRCPNVSMISEASFSRLVSMLNDDSRDAAIITAYNNDYDVTKKQNILRNRELRMKLNARQMGVYQLVGYWESCADSSRSIQDCPKEMLVQHVERSYVVVRPSTMSFPEFKQLMISLMNIDGHVQDAIIIKHKEKYHIYYSNGSVTYLGDKLSLNKIANSYSRSVLKIQVPFVFEGLEIPRSGVVAVNSFDKNKIYYILPEDEL